MGLHDGKTSALLAIDKYLVDLPQGKLLLFLPHMEHKFHDARMTVSNDCFIILPYSFSHNPFMMNCIISLQNRCD